MNRWLLVIVICVCGVSSVHAEEAAEAAVRQRLNAYLDAFNANEAAKVAAFWSRDAVSHNEETGEKVVGRQAIQEDFKTFFKDAAGARLTGGVETVRFVKPDVAIVEGQVTLFTPDDMPTPSAFTAVMIQEGGQWLIESSQEREPPSPPSPYEALRELEWLVGDWQDQSDDARVNTTVRWSANNAFLIRSFEVDYGEGVAFQGTQVIGWDANSQTIRSWNFNSDGSFGEGVVSRVGEDWMFKVVHTTSDGGTATASQVVSRVDDNTLSFQKVAHTVDGVPQPTPEAVTVIRVAAEEEATNNAGDSQ